MEPAFVHGNAEFYTSDCFAWLREREPNSIQGVVTDPPYGLVEYQPEQLKKRAKGKGGVWRIPPKYDGHERSPLPRFSVLSDGELLGIYRFFQKWGELLEPALVPGA
ncbi:MAG TPA: hypothetical protein VFB35_00255, partial [Gaiellaceae bacterium]|nr:hypothetical protein [Gaiellaceae bacterium]